MFHLSSPLGAPAIREQVAVLAFHRLPATSIQARWWTQHVLLVSLWQTIIHKQKAIWITVGDVAPLTAAWNLNITLTHRQRWLCAGAENLTSVFTNRWSNILDGSHPRVCFRPLESSLSNLAAPTHCPNPMVLPLATIQNHTNGAVQRGDNKLIADTLDILLSSKVKH